MVPNTMLGLFDSKSRCLDFWKAVQQLEKGVVGLRDEIDGAVGYASRVSCGEGTEILEVYQLSVAVVGGEVVGGEKICAQYSIPNVGNGELEGEICISYGDGAGGGAVALDVSAVCCAKLGATRSSTTLLRGGWDDGEERSSVHQPLLISSNVCDVKKEGISCAADDVVHDAYAIGFPFGVLC